ncbi:hypothetical protein [Streptomyces sp. NPDC059071]|uniref:hypothetical protein n=1 Tax=unclassified Streptomyces TaxID=2593676 RepID=UPI0036454453
MESPRASSPPGAGAVGRALARARTRRVPVPPSVAVGGFLLLLAVVFFGSYALGAAVGPVGAPAGSRSTPTSAPTPADDPGAPHHGTHR